MKAGAGTYEGELEHVLKETIPLVLYLGTIENLRAQKAADVHRVLTQRSSHSLLKARWTTQSPVFLIPPLLRSECHDEEVSDNQGR